MGKILMLPDWVFGRRWPLADARMISATSWEYRLMDLGLPERCVIWEVCVGPVYTASIYGSFCFKLCDQAPANQAAMEALESVFPACWDINGVQSCLTGPSTGPVAVRRLKVGLEVGGRRLVVGTYNSTGSSRVFVWSIVVSSVPTEVPDCLVSGMDSVL